MWDRSRRCNLTCMSKNRLLLGVVLIVLLVLLGRKIKKV